MKKLVFLTLILIPAMALAQKLNQKTTDPKKNNEMLLDAVIAAYNGNSVISPSVMRSLAIDDPVKPEIGSDLTEREKEILGYMADGLTNIEIADKLFISIRTVESHKNHIMARLELKTTVDLVKFAIRNNIVLL